MSTMSNRIGWVVSANPSRGSLAVARVEVIRDMSNGRSTFFRLDMHGKRVGNDNAPTSSIHAELADALVALAAHQWNAPPTGPVPECEHCAGERLKANALREAVLAACGVRS